MRPLWEHTGSNRGPSACKADALNQLSYAPLIWKFGKPLFRFGSAKIGGQGFMPKNIFRNFFSSFFGQ
jgi:hypothetical protein